MMSYTNCTTKAEVDSQENTTGMFVSQQKKRKIQQYANKDKFYTKKITSSFLNVTATYLQGLNAKQFFSLLHEAVINIDLYIICVIYR